MKKPGIVRALNRNIETKKKKKKIDRCIEYIRKKEEGKIYRRGCG